MKIKNLFITLGLALAAVGVAAGVGAANSSAKEAAAAPAGTTITSTYTYRITCPSSVPDTMYVHAWGSDGHNTDWGNKQFITLEDFSYNENGEKVFLFCTDYTYTGFLILADKDNPANWQSGNMTVNQGPAWVWDGVTGHYPTTWSVSNITYYFYDYACASTSGVKVYAKMSNGSYKNVADKASAPAMTAHSKSSGALYSISLDPMFDQITLIDAETGEDIVTDMYVNQHRGGVYSTKQFESSDWTSVTSALADDWIFNFMHLRDIPHNPEDGDTGACKADGENYLNLAVAAFNAYDGGVKTLITNYGVYYTNAVARLNAWASACEKVVTINASGATINNKSSLSDFVPTTETTTNNTTLIIVLASVITLAAVGGYFLLRRKED